MTETIHPTVEAANQWQELLRPFGGQVFPVVPDPHPASSVVRNKKQRESGQQPPDHEGKRPSTWVVKGDKWMIQPLAFNSATGREMRERWKYIDTSNLGVCLRLMGRLVAFDPDRKNVSEEEWIEVVTPWAMGLMEQGFYVERTGSGGFHILGLLPDERRFPDAFTLPGLEGKKVGEVKQDGGILVVAPTEREAGGKYEALSAPVLKTFARFRDNGVDFFFSDRLGEGGTYIEEETGGSGFLSQAAQRALREVPTGEPTEPDWWDLDDREKARRCLKYLPRDQDYGRGLWLKIGGAFWNIFDGGDEGLELFTLFSRETPGFKCDSDVEATWINLAKPPEGDRAGVGALKKWAEKGKLVIPPMNGLRKNAKVESERAETDIRKTVPFEERSRMFEAGLLELIQKEPNVLRRKGAARELKNELGLQYRDEELDSWLKRARLKAKGEHLLRMINCADLPEEFEEHPYEFVVPRLAIRGEVSELAGEPKATKTKLMIYAIKQALEGGDFLGEKCMKVDRVLLLISDQPQNRTEAYLHELGIRRHPRLTISPNFAMTEEHLDQVYSVMDDAKDKGEHLWIILDSLTSTTRACGIDENSPDIAEVIYDWGDQVAARGHTSTVIHHMSKRADGGSVSAGRGSSALAGAFSLVANLSRPKKKSEFSGETVSDADTPQRRLAVFSRARVDGGDKRIEILTDSSWKMVGNESEVAAAQSGSEERKRSSGTIKFEFAQALVALVDDRAAVDEEEIWGGMRTNDLAEACDEPARPEGGWSDDAEGAKSKKQFDAWRKRLSRWMESKTCPINVMAGGGSKGSDRRIGLNRYATEDLIQEAREVVELLSDEEYEPIDTKKEISQDRWDEIPAAV